MPATTICRDPRHARHRSAGSAASCTATARIGAASCARSSRSRLPTATSGWARWAAAARTRPARSPGSCPISTATTCSRSRRCASRSAIRRRACTTTGRSCTRRSSSPASTSSGQKLGVPVHALLGGKLRDDRRLRELSVLPLRRSRHRPRRGAHGGAARRQRGRAEGCARLHVAQAQGRRVSAARTSSRAIARWPRRCRASASGTTPIRRCRSPTRSSSAAASSTCATTITRIRSGACRS